MNIRSLLLLAIVGLATAIAAGFFGSWHPALDTFANFRAHFSVALLGLALIWIFRYGYIFGLFVLILVLPGLLFSVGMMGQYLYPSKPGTKAETTYTLLHLNLFYENATPQKVTALVARIDPDIIAFNEISSQWKHHLKELGSRYPHSWYCPEWEQIGGSMIYSRFLMTSDSGYCHAFSALSLKDVIIGNQKITIGAVHIRWPWPASGPRQVDQLKPVLNRLGSTAIVVGDYNSTVWTWLVQRFARYGSLQIIGGIGPSWLHQFLPRSWIKYFGFPIDNAMVKGDVLVRQVQALDPVGSDHLPVLIRFSLK